MSDNQKPLPWHLTRRWFDLSPQESTYHIPESHARAMVEALEKLGDESKWYGHEEQMRMMYWLESGEEPWEIAASVLRKIRVP